MIVLQILLVAWLPGALLLRLPGRSRAARAALAADERIFWTVLLSVVWSTTVVVLLALLGRYSFDRLLILNALIAVVAAVAGRQHLRLPRPLGRLSWDALVPAGLVVLGLWLYLPPAEYVIGGRDPGTYVNEGIQIAQRGQLVLTDPIVASVPPPFRDLFFPAHGTDTYYGLRFVGFFVQDPGAGLVVGQFPHFYPASITIGYGLNGLSGARQAVGVWTILALLAVYFAGAWLFGRTVAGIATALLAVNVITIWFARYPNTEVVMQAMLFAALLAIGRALDARQWFFPAVAGALLGIMLFLRYDAVLPIAACLAAAAIVPVTGRRVGRSFVTMLLVTGAAGVWYLLEPMRAYSAYPLMFTRANGGWIVAVGMLVAWWGVPRLLARQAVARIVTVAVPWTLTIAMAGLAVYAFFFRQTTGSTAYHDAAALRTYAWYVTPWIIGLAVAGYALTARRDFWRHPAFFLTFTTFALFFFYKTRIVPEHFWAARRFLPMILPGTLLFAVALAADVIGPRGLARLIGRRNGSAIGSRTTVLVGAVGVIVLAGAATPLAASYWSASRAVLHHVEYAGLIPQLEDLAARVGDRDLLLVEARNAGTDLHVLAMPLAYIYGRNVLVLDSAVPDKRAFEQFVAWAHTRYARVLFLGGGGTDLLTRTTHAESLGGTRFQVPEYDSPINAYPNAVHAKEFEYGLYALTTGPAQASAPIDLQIGAADDLYVVRFHARERDGTDGRAYRWTGPQSFILLMGLQPEARHLIVWMSDGGRPASAPPATVHVALDDEEIGAVTVGPTLAPYAFDLPPDLATRLSARQDPVRLRLRVPTWNPHDALGLPDTRDLGVMVGRVQVP